MRLRTAGLGFTVDCDAMIIFNVAHTDTRDILRPEPEHYIGSCVATSKWVVEPRDTGVSNYYTISVTVRIILTPVVLSQVQVDTGVT